MTEIRWGSVGMMSGRLLPVPLRPVDLLGGIGAIQAGGLVSQADSTSVRQRYGAHRLILGVVVGKVFRISATSAHLGQQTKTDLSVFCMRA